MKYKVMELITLEDEDIYNGCIYSCNNKKEAIEIADSKLEQFFRHFQEREDGLCETHEWQVLDKNGNVIYSVY